MRIEKLFGCLVKSYTCRSDKDNNPIYLDVLEHNASSFVFPVHKYGAKFILLWKTRYWQHMYTMAIVL